MVFETFRSAKALLNLLDILTVDNIYPLEVLKFSHLWHNGLPKVLDDISQYATTIVFTIAAPAFDILFIGCVLNTKIVYTTAEELTFEAFY